jgi:hypothetical protein
MKYHEITIKVPLELDDVMRESSAVHEPEPLETIDAEARQHWILGVLSALFVRLGRADIAENLAVLNGVSKPWRASPSHQPN